MRPELGMEAGLGSSSVCGAATGDTPRPKCPNRKKYTSNIFYGKKGSTKALGPWLRVLDKPGTERSRDDFVSLKTLPSSYARVTSENLHYNVGLHPLTQAV